MHDGDDTWTALEQVDSPSGPSTCGRGERLIQDARGGHFILMLHSTAVGELYHTAGGGSQGSQGVRTRHPRVKKEKNKINKALLNEPI